MTDLFAKAYEKSNYPGEAERRRQLHPAAWAATTEDYRALVAALVAAGGHGDIVRTGVMGCDISAPSGLSVIFADGLELIPLIPGPDLLDLSWDAEGAVTVVRTHVEAQGFWKGEGSTWQSRMYSAAGLPDGDVETFQYQRGNVVRHYLKDGEKDRWPSLAAFLADARKPRQLPEGGRIDATLNQLAEALGGTVEGEWVRCPSPKHGPEDRSLAVRPSKRSPYGFIVHPHSNADLKEDCRAYVQARMRGLDWGADGDEEITEPDGDGRPDGERHQGRDTTAYAQQLWDEAEGETQKLVARYLHARGIGAAAIAAAFDSGSLRAHPGVWHKGSERTWPAMLARVQLPGSSDMIAVHVTFLALNGRSKAPVEPVRRLYGKPAGGIVRLIHRGLPSLYVFNVIIGEGLETCLAGFDIFKRDMKDVSDVEVWSALSAGNLAKLDVMYLDNTSPTMWLLSDGDKAGEHAIARAAARWGDNIPVKVVRFGKDKDAADAL